jgi:hypothetical protein
MMSMHAASRALELLGLVVTGVGFFSGVLGGNVRLELWLLAAGAAVFFLGRRLEKTAR